MSFADSTDADADESDLLASAIAGDAIAMQALLLVHRTVLCAYIRRKLPDAVRSVIDVEDIWQETCVKAFGHIRTFVAPPGASNEVARWLMTIARNYMAETLRKAETLKRGGGQHQLVPDDRDDCGTVASMLQTLAVYRRTPSISAAAHELTARLEESIERLPPDWHRAVTLRHVDGLSIKEAAERMSRTEGAVQQLCHRALRQLREDLRSMSMSV